MFKNLVCFQVGNGIEVVKLVEEQKIDLIILDLEMPQQNGYATMEILKKMINRPKVIILSFHDDVATVLKCVSSGAQGFLSKDVGIAKIKEGINIVMNDDFYFPLQISNSDSIANSQCSSVQHNLLFEKLNAIEMKILFYLLQQYTSKQIADKVNLSIRTVQDYRSAIFRKTNTTNILGLVWCIPPPPKKK